MRISPNSPSVLRTMCVRDVARCMAYGRKYPGYVIKVTGDLPHNIPLDNIRTYFDTCRELGRL